MNLREAVADYGTSEHFSLLEASLKPRAEAILSHWCDQVGPAPSLANLAPSLEGLAQLDLPLAARRNAPQLLSAFFAYLATTGHFADAGLWADCVDDLQADYAARFRDDGSFRGQTQKQKLPKVGRNEPCPCGSGLKFKKCCIALLS